MRQALGAHLAWGAFPTPGYTALRKSLQARVLSVAAPVIERASRVHVTLAVEEGALYGIARFASVESSPPSPPPPPAAARPTRRRRRRRTPPA